MRSLPKAAAVILFCITHTALFAQMPTPTPTPLVRQIVLDDFQPGSLTSWDEIYNPADQNPAFYYEEVLSPFDGTTALRTRCVGNTLSTCARKYVRKIYDVGLTNSSSSWLTAHIDFTWNGTYYNLPYVTVELLDEVFNPLASGSFYGHGIIGRYFLDDPERTKGFHELPSSSGLQMLDLSQIGLDIRFTMIAISLSNYTCQGQNSITIDHLVYFLRDLLLIQLRFHLPLIFIRITSSIQQTDTFIG